MTDRSAWSRSRTGVSTLGLVVFIVLVISLVQIQQHVFMSQVTQQAGHSVVGRAAHEIGVAAAREARNIVGLRVNRPGTAEFELLRVNPPRPGTLAPVVLSISDLVETRSLIESVYKNVHELTQIEATLSYMIPLTKFDGGEFEGVLTVRAGVKSLIEDGVERFVDRQWVFKVVRVAPVSMLQKTQVFIRDPELVFKGNWDTHAITKQYVTEKLPALGSEVVKFLGELTKLEEQAQTAEQKQQLSMLRALYGPLVEGAGGGRIGQALARVQSRFQGLTPLPLDVKKYVLAFRGGDLPIKEIRLQQDFDALVEQHRIIKERSDQLGESVKQAADATQATLTIHQQYAESIGQLAEQMAAIAERYVHFRELFETIVEGDASFEFYQRSHDLLDPVGRLPGLENDPKFDARICFIINEGLAAGTIDEGLDRLLARLDREGKGVSGTILVENPTQKLTLTGSYTGRWTLGVTGSLDVEDLRRADAGEDLFTLVHVASPEGNLSLSGDVEATVVCSGSRLLIQPGTNITGGLFLNDVDPRAEIKVSDGDTIKRDPRREIDAKWQIHVIISPWTRTLTSGRQT